MNRAKEFNTLLDYLGHSADWYRETVSDLHYAQTNGTVTKVDKKLIKERFESFRDYFEEINKVLDQLEALAKEFENDARR